MIVWDEASVSHLIGHKEQLQFFHQVEAKIPADFTAYSAFCKMTGDPSWPLQLAFKIRDRLSTLAGVKEIKGFGATKPKQPPKVGEHFDFFTIEGISDDELLLTSRDKHLSVLLALRLEPRDTGQKALLLTTSVLTHNAFGKIYMIPVGLTHGFIVKNSLKKIAVK